MSESGTPPHCSADDVLAFWLAAGRERWFKHDDSFDTEVRAKFAGTYEAAAAGLLRAWESSPQHALALVIALDQFPRNMFRGSARAFATDPQARAVAERALGRGFDRQIELPARVLFYLPFEHAEDLADQERAVALIRETGDADLTEWAMLHADIIRRFGRFPHRNASLDRTSTAQEQAFLDAGGFRG